MREARIILPLFSADTMHTISEVFGGYTIYTAQGSWRGQVEYVDVVDIAYDPTPEADEALWNIADNYRRAAKQESVYLRYGNGFVQLVDASGKMDNGEKPAFDWDAFREELHRTVSEDIGEIPDEPCSNPVEPS